MSGPVVSHDQLAAVVFFFFLAGAYHACFTTCQHKGGRRVLRDEDPTSASVFAMLLVCSRFCQLGKLRQGLEPVARRERHRGGPPLLKGESKVEMKTLITPAAAEQSSSAPMTSAPAKKWELVGGYEPKKDAELTPEHIARYRDILTKLSPDDARGSKQHVELHSRGEGGGGGSAIRKEEDDDAQGGGQGDGSGSIPFPFLTLHQSHVALFVPSAT
jgi:hypothetical protein